jgi:hypothetical protein
MAATPSNIADLVEKMPLTDQEIEAQKAPPPGQPTDPAKPKPKPDRLAGSKFTAPDPALVEQICADILGGGRDCLVELIALIRDPASDDFKNYKAEYLCHCLTMHVGRPEREAPRRLFIDTLVSQVGNQNLPLHTRGFLVRELQLIGDRQAVAAVGSLLTEPKLCDDAARTLLAINDGVVGSFREALPNTSGRTRLVVLQSLAVLRDVASADAFQKAVTDADREIRLTGAWGLARLGSAGSIDLLLKAAGTEDGWERIKATQACLVLAENLAAAGRKNDARKIYTHLQTTRTDAKEKYIRDLATKALVELSAPT